MPSLHRFLITRYYIRTVCILCGDTILHNQYNNNKLFSRTAHVECVRQHRKGRKRSRMNDYVVIEVGVRNGKRMFKEI